MSIEISNLPKRLYRYQSLATTQLVEYSAQIIRDHKLYLASAEQYNDPFEGRYTLSLAATDEERFRKFKAGLLDQGRPEAAAVAEAQRMVDHPDPTLTDGWEDSVETELVAKYRSSIGLLSLTAKYDDTLMWSYYADAHKGICFEFDTEVQSVISSAAPVRYQALFPELRFFMMNPEEMAYAIALTKNSAWAHEAEWRVIAIDQAGTSPSFPPEALTAVILGAQIESDRQAQILELLGQRGVPVRVDRMAIAPGEYRLSVQKEAHQVGHISASSPRPSVAADDHGLSAD